MIVSKIGKKLLFPYVVQSQYEHHTALKQKSRDELQVVSCLEKLLFRHSMSITQQRTHMDNTTVKNICH